jgi:hypothetical protein
VLHTCSTDGDPEPARCTIVAEFPPLLGGLSLRCFVFVAFAVWKRKLHRTVAGLSPKPDIQRAVAIFVVIHETC